MPSVLAILLVALLVILISGSIVFYLACAFCAYRFAITQKSGESDRHPPISLMVPVCGLDAGAWENWSSLCQQNYPDYEILFGVADTQDPAIPVLSQLAQTFPERVQLFTGLEPRGINHKDSTLSYLLEKVRHELIIFIDSDIRVNQTYLQTVVAPLVNREVGVVTCAFVGHDPQSLGAALASLGRCVDFIPSALIAQVLDGGLRFTIGTTIATRRSTLANFGGLHLNRIGSDYNLGKRAAQAGHTIELSSYILESDTGRENVAAVFRRELRWARTIRYNRGAQYYSIAFCYGTVYCLPLLWLVGFAPWAVYLSLATLVIRYGQVLLTVFCLNCPKLLYWLWAIPLRDLLSFGIWVMGAFGQEVYWRGRRLRIYGDGLIQQRR